MPADASYNQSLHGPYEEFELGELDLEEGGRLRGAKLAYATFGALSPARDNAILIPTWYSGTSKIWEQVYIGRGRALDPCRRGCGRACAGPRLGRSVRNGRGFNPAAA